MRISDEARPVIWTVIYGELKDIGLSGSTGKRIANVLTHALMHTEFYIPIQNKEAE